MRQLIAYKQGRAAPDYVEEGGYFPHIRNGVEHLVGFGSGELVITPEDVLRIALQQPDERDIADRMSDALQWLSDHGCDYPEQIDLSRPPAYGVESYVRNAGPDRFGVHGAKAPPISVQSRIRATG